MEGKIIGRITINDIARELSVSANTVSKALNGKGKVSEELRAKIVDTAKRVGYEKNINASRLSQKTVNIGVLVVGHDENFYRYMIKGLEKAADHLADCRVKITIRVVDGTKGSLPALSVLEEFADQGYDGVVINDLNDKQLGKILEQYKEKGIKYAFLNYDVPEVDCEFAVVNDYAAAAGLAAEVLSLCTDTKKTLAVYAHNSRSYGQRQLAGCFCQAAKNAGYEKTIVSSDMDEIFSVENVAGLGGIYVSHASYLEICRKMEEMWTDLDRPKLIVSDLYGAGVPYLEKGIISAIIYQEPEEQAFQSVVKLYEVICEGKKPERVLTIKPVVIMKSNFKKYVAIELTKV